MVNTKQQFAIEKCIAILDGWLNTNDIKSPSHYNIIEEAIFDLKIEIGEGANCDLIGDTLNDLLNIIKHLK